MIIVNIKKEKVWLEMLLQQYIITNIKMFCWTRRNAWDIRWIEFKVNIYFSCFDDIHPKQWMWCIIYLNNYSKNFLIIQIVLILSLIRTAFLSCILNLKNTKHLKKDKWNFCMWEDKKKEIENIFTEKCFSCIQCGSIMTFCHRNLCMKTWHSLEFFLSEFVCYFVLKYILENI